MSEPMFISIYAAGLNIRVGIELIKVTDQVEEYRVIGRDRVFILRGNRPQLLALGLKARKPDWKLIEGEMRNAAALRRIIEVVDAMSKTRHKPDPPPGNPKYAH